MTEKKSTKSPGRRRGSEHAPSLTESRDIEIKPELDSAIGKSRIRARVTEFAYPPVHDGVVIGRTAQLGLEAFRKALDLLVAVPFVHLHVDDDDIVGDVLVRHALLRRVDQAKLLSFVMRKIKPLMSSEEILHLDLQIEVEIDEESE
ncbi:MAG: hypothetical protein ABJE95_33185 [Byssovorax sp.]